MFCTALSLPSSNREGAFTYEAERGMYLQLVRDWRLSGGLLSPNA